MNQSVPKEVYATLSGDVDANMVKRVFDCCSAAVNNQVETVHLLIQSPGGNVGDGIGIYNYLRNLPLELITYNGGCIASAAVIIFLAAKVRKTSATANFIIHKTFLPTNPGANTAQLKLLAEGLSCDDQRTEKILRTHINLPAKKWRNHRLGDLNISAQEAVEFGLCQEIADFIPTHTSQLYSI